jgi:hypothetical protein
MVLMNIDIRTLTTSSKCDRIFLPLAEFIMNARVKCQHMFFSAFHLSHGMEPRLLGDELPAVLPGYFDWNDA